MAQVNPLTRELLVKLVYYGPGLGGKTTSLQAIHGASPPESRGQLVSLATPVDRTLYFDFLPLRTRSVREHHVRLQLFTVPGQVYLNATRKLVLSGVDGLVFVADSQPGRLDANQESAEDLALNIEEQGRSLDDIPLVVQLNKRDLPGVMGDAELRRSLPLSPRAVFPTVATTGEGVLPALERLVDETIADLEGKGTFGEIPRPTPTPQFSAPSDGLDAQIHAASERWSAELLRGRNVEGPSWAALFEERGHLVRNLEQQIVQGNFPAAIIGCDALLRSCFEEVIVAAGGHDPLMALPLLGIAAPRWLAFRRIVGRAETGGPLDARDALQCFLLLLEVHSRRGMRR